MNSGFLLVDKPKGWTSFDVCAKLRGTLGVKRIGHTGTLDPFATGLLIIAVGKATKLIPFLEKDRKTYVTKIRFGVTSDTLDPTGVVSELESEKVGTVERVQVESVLEEEFLGKIEQVPPKYSALKMNGKKLYELARAGKDVEIKSREAEVFGARVLGYEYPYVDIGIESAAGFYVRSFARDLAESLGTVGICWELRRVGVGEIVMNDECAGMCRNEIMKIMNEVDLKEGRREDFELIDPKKILKIPQVEIDTERLDDFCGGRAFSISNTQQSICNEEGKLLVLCEGRSVGVGEILHDKLQPRVVL